MKTWQFKFLTPSSRIFYVSSLLYHPVVCHFVVRAVTVAVEVPLVTV